MLIFVLGFGLIYSCTNDSDESGSEPADSAVSFVEDNSSSATKRGGWEDVIAELGPEGEFILTVDEEILIEAFKRASGENLYDYSQVEIVKSVLEDDQSNIEYLLIATTTDQRITTAVELTNDRAREVLTLNMEVAKLTCTSECQFGCKPTRIRNPLTRLIEITCSRCMLGEKCTKTWTVG